MDFSVLGEGVKMSRIIRLYKFTFLDGKCLPEGSWICCRLHIEYNNENIFWS